MLDSIKIKINSFKNKSLAYNDYIKIINTKTVLYLILKNFNSWHKIKSKEGFFSNN